MPSPLDNLEVSNVAEITQEMFVNTANQALARPMLITLFLGMILIFLFIGLSIVKKNKSRFMSIWAISSVLSLVLLIMLIMNPNFFFDALEGIIEWLKSFGGGN